MTQQVIQVGNTLDDGLGDPIRSAFIKVNANFTEIYPVQGCFHKTANVTASSADTAFSFDWYTDTTAHINNQGIIVDPDNPTHITISKAGTYVIFIEMQVTSTVNASREAYLWLAKNNLNLAESACKIEIKQGGATPAHQLISKHWVLPNIEENDYIELLFAVDNISGISLEYMPAQTIPYVRPAIPSAILSIARI